MNGISKEIKTIFGVSKASDAFDQFFCPSVELDELLKNGYQSELKVLKRALYETKPSFAENLVKRQTVDAPILTIITSLFKGDEYIDGFLENTSNQIGFENFELIILNCNSPGNEESKILSYCEKLPNIVYKKLEKDPGLYGAWNLGIEMSKGRYLTNANLDDRKSYAYYLLMLDWMMSNNYDVGASLFWTCSNLPEHGFEEDALIWYKDFSAFPSFFDFFKSDKSWTQIQDQCIVGPMPIWKKSVHNLYGKFEEFNYGPSADYAMWLKLMRNGCSFGLYRVPLVYYLKLANSYARRVDTSALQNIMLKETFIDFLMNQKSVS
jgi:glycosyltransferase involved in cell wall biosynthesis